MDLTGYEFPSLNLSMDGFEPVGPVLDLGGGGEGVIGQIGGKAIIAIDRRMDELCDAPDGPRKVMMDARKLGFPGQYFPMVTAFFSLMFVPNVEDQTNVFAEAQRVLKPGGVFHFWDVNLPETPPKGMDYFVVNLRYRIRGKETGTGYGMHWPGECRNAQHYVDLAERAGLVCVNHEALQHCFYLQFRKM